MYIEKDRCAILTEDGYRLHIALQANSNEFFLDPQKSGKKRKYYAKLLPQTAANAEEEYKALLSIAHEFMAERFFYDKEYNSANSFVMAKNAYELWSRARVVGYIPKNLKDVTEEEMQEIIEKEFEGSVKRFDFKELKHIQKGRIRSDQWLYKKSDVEILQRMCEYKNKKNAIKAKDRGALEYLVRTNGKNLFGTLGLFSVCYEDMDVDMFASSITFAAENIYLVLLHDRSRLNDYCSEIISLDGTKPSLVQAIEGEASSLFFKMCTSVEGLEALKSLKEHIEDIANRVMNIKSDEENAEIKKRILWGFHGLKLFFGSIVKFHGYAMLQSGDIKKYLGLLRKHLVDIYEKGMRQYATDGDPISIMLQVGYKHYLESYAKNMQEYRQRVIDIENKKAKQVEIEEVAELFEEKLIEMDMFDENGDIKLDYKSYKENIKRFMQIVNKNGRVLIYGDYDVDGIFSSMMMYLFTKSLNKNLYNRKDFIVDIRFSSRNAGFGMTKEDYEKFSKEYDYIVITDTGSSLPFLNENIGNLLVLDHHPAPKAYPFIINPNIDNDNPYLTSGGKIVYDFIKNTAKAYQTILNKDVLTGNLDKVLKEFRALTLLSDMALLTRENRRYIIDALDSIKREPILPMFAFTLDLNKDITATDLSFSIISKVNGFSRMGEDIGELVEWIFPSSIEEFRRVSNKMSSAHKDKMRLVNKEVLRKYFSECTQEEMMAKECHFLYIDHDMHGINGLIANKLFQAFNKPAFVMSNFDDKHIIGSARGHFVKDILRIVYEKLGYDTFGGHEQASGFTIKKEDLQRFKNYLEEAVRLYEGKVSEIAVVTKEPIGVSEFLQLQKIYKNYARGVDFYTKISQAIENFDVVGVKKFESGYAMVRICDGFNKEDTIDFFVDTNVLDVDELPKRVLLMDFNPSQASMRLAVEREAYEKILPYMRSVIMKKEETKKQKKKKAVAFQR